MLTADEILKEGLLKLTNSKGKAAQVGYDLSIMNVMKIGFHETIDPHTLFVFEGRIGKILVDKTELTDYCDVPKTKIDGRVGWFLYPGTYDITFYEGCKIPDNRAAFIVQRSSLKRNGSSIQSPIFDPGFETDNMGTVMHVHETIFIEEGARVAQIYFLECTPVSTPYNGQWQNDNQREKKQ